MLLNMGPRAETFTLPALPGTGDGGRWAVAVDTVAASPADLVSPEDQRPLGADRLRLGARAVVVLEGPGARC
jgi:hypothetical protein